MGHVTQKEKEPLMQRRKPEVTVCDAQCRKTPIELEPVDGQ